MSLPVYDPTKHDIGIDGVGFMMSVIASEAAPVSLMRLDAEPATARAALGDSSSESFSLSSFFFQNNLGGGVGQATLKSIDRGNVAVAETGIEGHIFPPKAVLTTGSIGGGTHGYFRIGSALYGINGSTVERIDTGSTWSGAEPPLNGARPEVSVTRAAFWTSETHKLFRFRPMTGLTNITNRLPGSVTPYLVRHSGAYLWCVGTTLLPASFTIVQSATYTNSSDDVSPFQVNLDNTPSASSILLAAVFGPSSNLGIDTGSMNTNWKARAGGSPSANSFANILTLERPEVGDRFGSFVNATTSASGEGVYFAELAGIDPDNPVLDTHTATDSVTEGANTWTLSGLNTQSGHVFAVIWFQPVTTDTQTTVSSFPVPTGWTDLMGLVVLDDDSTSNDKFWARVIYKANSTDASLTGTLTWDWSGGSPPARTVQGRFIKFRPTSLDIDLEQTVHCYSSNDGETWKILDTISSGAPLPVAGHASQGSLWETTEFGLYELAHGDTETSDSTAVTAATRGPMDDFQYPLGAEAIGTHPCSFDGSIYYNLGSTVRRFPPGGRAEQIWPPRGWGSGGGTVVSMTSGEGGVYWGAVREGDSHGYLWRYDGFGFHQIAKATADQLRVLHWHQGRLYLAGDPAPYLNYGYPSLRPDVTHPGPETYTTGAVVTSILNLEKIGDPKVVRRFETHAEFTLGDAAAESGHLVFQYLLADSGRHPDIYDALDETLDWVTIGEHSIEDGNVKTYLLDTPITFYNLYLRVKLEPGSLGIPICEGYGMDGETLMQRRVRLALQLSLSTTDTTDRRGVKLYPEEADLAAAINKLKSLRDRDHADYTPYFNVTYRETGGTQTTHLCIAEKLDDWLESHQGTDGQFSHTGASLILRELP